MHEGSVPLRCMRAALPNTNDLGGTLLPGVETELVGEARDEKGAIRERQAERRRLRGRRYALSGRREKLRRRRTKQWGMSTFDGLRRASQRERSRRQGLRAPSQTVWRRHVTLRGTETRGDVRVADASDADEEDDELGMITFMRERRSFSGSAITNRLHPCWGPEDSEIDCCEPV